MFTDTHCHLFSEYYDNIDEVIKDAESNNVNRFINNATDLSNIDEVINSSKKFNNLYYALGIHPDSVDDDLDKFKEIIERNLNDSKFIAIGEIGLDYHYGKENKDRQIEFFEYQLSLAEKYNLPVIIHSRDATQDTLECIRKFKVKGVMHCFNGSLEVAKEYIKLGFYFGIGGVITFKNAKLYEIVKEIPLENILLETDAPYLTPEPFRKYKNEPKYVYEIAIYLSKLYNISIEEISFITEKNVTNLFDI